MDAVSPARPATLNRQPFALRVRLAVWVLLCLLPTASAVAVGFGMTARQNARMMQMTADHNQQMLDMTAAHNQQIMDMTARHIAQLEAVRADRQKGK